MSERDQGRSRLRFGRAEQEVITAAVLLGVFVYLRYYLSALIAGRTGVDYVDPDFWPGWLLNVAIVFSAVYLVQQVVAVIRARTADGADEAERPSRATPPRPVSDDTGEHHEHVVALSGHLVRLLVGFALLWAYIYSMRYLGFVPSTLAFSVIFLLFLGERRWPAVVGFPIVLVGVLLYTFTRLLVVPLPRGIGPFLELSTFFY